MGDLPDLLKRNDQAEKHIEEWITFKWDYQPAEHSRGHKNRKSSLVEEATSHRSTRDK
jgi:hypothetical protein